MTDKLLSSIESEALISDVDRAELYENPRVYLKAVRSTLIALGYNPEWVNGEFREALELAYLSDSGVDPAYF